MKREHSYSTDRESECSKDTDEQETNMSFKLVIDEDKPEQEIVPVKKKEEEDLMLIFEQATKKFGSLTTSHTNSAGKSKTLSKGFKSTPSKKPSISDSFVLFSDSNTSPREFSSTSKQNSKKFTKMTREKSASFSTSEQTLQIPNNVKRHSSPKLEEKKSEKKHQT